jgi:hypothetical protein
MTPANSASAARCNDGGLRRVQSAEHTRKRASPPTRPPTRRTGLPSVFCSCSRPLSARHRHPGRGRRIHNVSIIIRTGHSFRLKNPA